MKNSWTFSVASELATRRLSNRPAASECLQRKSTQQDERNAAYIYVQSQS
ncbi:hypothetical protein [Heyndrickxia acidicola]|uniref:Uncharacterized protein n=1 Tax=Heyndrickxia acidicola TaxID=209389 RepID=A0ABU6MIU9_9BACI|nr:hypothetical protein [Heyndrickxia acidicola]MED1202995.1 hypothetical protein [Heyndrickxia acidicola]